MNPKTKNLIIYALIFVVIVAIQDAIAFPMEREKTSEAKKIFSLTPQAATEQKRRASESSEFLSEEDNENLERGDTPRIAEEKAANGINTIEEFASTTLKDAANKAKETFKELLVLPRDAEGNILDPSKQEALRPKILQALKEYEDQRQAWIAQATTQRLAEVETLEKATAPITFEIVKDLDVSTEKGKAVFWTGYTLENQRTAMAYAWEQGKKTIEMTQDGKLLDQLGMYKSGSPIATSETNAQGEVKYKSKLGDLLFDAVSTKFAQAAHGKVTAVIYKPQTADDQAAYKRSAYARIEEPILLAREEAGESVELGNGRIEVPVDITLPVLRTLIKENTELKKGTYLIGELGTRLAAGNLSSNQVDRINDILNDIHKNEVDQQKLQQKAKSTNLKKREVSQLEEEFQKTKATQVELINRLWNFAERIHMRTQEAWQAVIRISENDSTFWSQWEDSVELAKEAHHAWKEFSQRTQQHILEREQANQQKTSWLKKINTFWNWLSQDKQESEFLAKLSIQLNQAEEYKNFWLEKLKTAKIKPPLEPLVIKEKEKKPAITVLQEIALPEVDEGDAERFSLLQEIQEKEDLKNNSTNIPITRPRRGSSFAADYPPVNITSLDKQLDEKWTHYNKLTEAADIRRIENLKTLGIEPALFPSDKKNEELHNAWKRRDFILQRQQEQEKIRLENEARKARLEADWENNILRWSALYQANKTSEAFKDQERDYEKHSKENHWQSEAWKETLREKANALDHWRKEKEITQKEWEWHLKEHPELRKAYETKDNITAIKDQITKSDNVILALRDDFKEHTENGLLYDTETRTRSAFPHEIENCKNAFRDWKKSILEMLDKEKLSLEEYISQYINLIKQAALRDAEHDAPGDREAYEAMVLESKKEATDFKKTNEENEKSQRLDGIAAADEVGKDTWLARRQFIDDVKKRWIEELEKLTDRRLAAVKAHFEDNPLPWILLSREERNYYNNPLEWKREDQKASNIKKASAILENRREAWRNINASTSNAEKARLEKEKEKAYQQLIGLFEKEILEKKQWIKEAYQEVERFHAPEVQSFFSGPTTKQKQQAIDEYIKRNIALFELESEFRTQKRKCDYEKIALPLEQQNKQEEITHASEQKQREEYFSWFRLTPQGKRKEIEELRKSISEAKSKTSELEYKLKKASDQVSEWVKQH